MMAILFMNSWPFIPRSAEADARSTIAARRGSARHLWRLVRTDGGRAKLIRNLQPAAGCAHNFSRGWMGNDGASLENGRFNMAVNARQLPELSDRMGCSALFSLQALHIKIARAVLRLQDGDLCV